MSLIHFDSVILSETTSLQWRSILIFIVVGVMLMLRVMIAHMIAEGGVSCLIFFLHPRGVR